MQIQQGEVNVFQTPDDGDVCVIDGLVEMNGGLPSAFYISTFGGNEEDDGRPNNSLTWWGNLDEQDPNARMISETQHILQTVPANSNNRSRLVDAVTRDISWLSELSVITDLSVVVTLPELNRVNIRVDAVANGEPITINFLENWKADI